MSIDEYFDLRQKAEINAFLMKRLGNFEAHLANIDTRVYGLELGKEKS